MGGEILGAYRSSGGGRIYLNPAGNLEAGAAAGTLFHEECHWWLSRTTALGVLQSAMEMALYASEDLAAAKQQIRCIQILAEKSREVQEIFATNQHLLKLQEVLGLLEAQRILLQLPPAYQGYWQVMEPVRRAGTSLKHQRQVIADLCVYAMAVILPPGSTGNPSQLCRALQGDRSPSVRLRKALDHFLKTGEVPVQAADDGQLLRSLQTEAGAISRELEEEFRQLPHLMKQLRAQATQYGTASLDVSGRMLRRVCLFEPIRISAQETAAPPDSDCAALLWRMTGSAPAFDYCHLLFWQNGYRQETLCGAQLADQGKSCHFPCLLFSDAEALGNQAFSSFPAAVVKTVILQTLEECRQCFLTAGPVGTVYVGELQAASQQTGIRLLLFCRREDCKTIYLFPTISEIRDRLLEQTGWTAQCALADSRLFLRLFGAFSDEAQVFSYLKSCIQLLLGRSWKDLSQSPCLRPLVCHWGRSLFESALRIQPRDHFRRLASLPQRNTPGQPLFCLMRFEGDWNTGDTFVEGNTNSVLLFLSRDAAAAFAEHYAPAYTPAGIDRIYWPAFYEMILCQTGRAVLALNRAGTLGRHVMIQELAERLGLPAERQDKDGAASPQHPGSREDSWV